MEQRITFVGSVVVDDDEGHDWTTARRRLDDIIFDGLFGTYDGRVNRVIKLEWIDEEDE